MACAAALKEAGAYYLIDVEGMTAALRWAARCPGGVPVKPRPACSPRPPRCRPCCVGRAAGLATDPALRDFLLGTPPR